MAVERQRITVEQFDTFVEQSENDDKLFEYIGGEIVEVPSNPLSSMIAALVLAEIINYLKRNNIGVATGADGGYMVSGERYVPDAAFIAYERQPNLPDRGYNPNPPNLAVEVVSDETSARELDRLMTKVGNFVAAGTMVWVFYPQAQVARVHAPGQPIQVIERDGILDGGDVLPGFKFSLSDIFPQR
jgi:Uma2 family endonuclease